MKYILFFSLFLINNVFGQSYKVIESTDDFIRIEFNFDGYTIKDTLIDNLKFNYIKGKSLFLGKEGEPWLPSELVDIALPKSGTPSITIEKIESKELKNIFIIPFSPNDTIPGKIDVYELNKDVYNNNNIYPEIAASFQDDFTFRYLRIGKLAVYPFQFNPVSRSLNSIKKLIVKISYNGLNSLDEQSIVDFESERYLKNCINSNAVKFVSKSISLSSSKSLNDWYDPSKTYYKIFVKDSALFRVTFDELAQRGASSSSINTIALYVNGALIPIYINDINGDGLFGTGEYLEFIGFPAVASPYSYKNIYNSHNVYWLTLFNEQSLYYNAIDGNLSNFENTFTSTIKKIHYEEDRIYERLGYAPDDKRDYWFWGKASSQSNVSLDVFTFRFPGLPHKTDDSNYFKIKSELHGLTNSIYCNPDHKADFYINGKSVGSLIWDGQKKEVFEKSFNILSDSITIWDPTEFRVDVADTKCGNDEIRINWLEVEYWRYNRADSHSYFFSSPPNTNGIIRFYTWNWMDQNNVRIFIPSKNKIITNYAINNSDNGVLFTDTLTSQTDYFMVQSNFFKSPDSIITDVSSNLLSSNNSADYIIISHKNFSSAAERLKNIREKNSISEISNPRVFIAYVDDIYDEFSNGLVDPYALRNFVKHAFDNWGRPAPLYVVLMGDMSWDYRMLVPGSTPNYVPSIGYHAYTYGQAISDNMIAAVAGNDVVPDLAIGRISVKNIQEANIVIDKIENYPADPGKEWKENVLLISSGQNAADEIVFGFNDANMQLQNDYTEPAGLATTKVFRFPNKPEYEPFRGEGLEIRREIDNGAALINYYGHGGSYQWDLVFLNEDIYMLNNGGRLPVISSMTCYTAHLDNQDAFGEQFLNVPNKGCIGFFGSTGLTLWLIGSYMNNVFFREVITNQEYNMGKALMNTKAKMGQYSYSYTDQIALVNYLGDPAIEIPFLKTPDFRVKAKNIIFDSESSITAGDTTNIKVVIENLGIKTRDSVNVELRVSQTDTSYVVGVKKIPGFGNLENVFFSWAPIKGGLHTVTVIINNGQLVPEPDITDNTASLEVAVFDLSEPSILMPLNGYAFRQNEAKVKIVDLGGFISAEVSYDIQIDTSLFFSSIIKQASKLNSVEGIAEWDIKDLPIGNYFLRAKASSSLTEGAWNNPIAFSVIEQPSEFVLQNNLLQLLSVNSSFYNPVKNGITLITNLQNPRPSVQTFIEEYSVDTLINKDSIKVTAATTDGSFIYFGNLSYYAAQLNGTGFSAIYKVGTGNNGTVKGQYYGTLGNFYDQINNTIFHHAGSIYVATGNPYALTRINTSSGFIDTVNVPAGLLNWDKAQSLTGGFYLNSDGNKIFNLTFRDSTGTDKFILRTFNPDFSLASTDLSLFGKSYGGTASSFFVVGDEIYIMENYYSNFIRRYNIYNGNFIEEWFANVPFRNYYSIFYDNTVDNIYAISADPAKTNVSKYLGHFTFSKGSAETIDIGPASKWNSLSYTIDNQNPAEVTASLLGYNRNENSWVLLKSNPENTISIDTLDATIYPNLKMEFNFNNPTGKLDYNVVLKDIKASFTPISELMLTPDFVQFDNDTIQQGFNTTITAKVKNIGYSPANNINISYTLDNADTIIHNQSFSSIPVDSTVTVSYSVNTAVLANAAPHKIKTSVLNNSLEYYNFNNILTKSFFVARDSVNPNLNITFDGQAIINGDVVSSNPEIVITLNDESPLPLDTSAFFIYFDNKQIFFNRNDLQTVFTQYPNNQAVITWKPDLEDGRHTIDLLAKDATSNYSDTISTRIIFYVINDFNLLNVYNYPNPFKTDTHFTFDLHGDDKKIEEAYLKIYTIAGRLIRNYVIPVTSLKTGFNKIQWDGKDEDGDEIANGVYLYKLNIKYEGQTKSVTQKLAKVK